MADWSQLGSALGGMGDSSLEFAKGQNLGMQNAHLGAETQNAMAQADERVQKQKALQAIPEQFRAMGKALGLGDEVMVAAGGALQAGRDPQEVVGLALKAQEFQNRKDAVASAQAGNSAGMNASLAGVANGPVKTLEQVGTRNYTDIMHPEAGLKATPGSGQRIVDFGGVKYVVDMSAESPDGVAPSATAPTGALGDALAPPAPAAPRPLVSLAETAKNAGTIAGAKAAAVAPYKTTAQNAVAALSPEDQALVTKAMSEGRLPATLSRYQLQSLPLFAAAERQNGAGLDAASYPTHVAGAKDMTSGATSRNLTAVGTLVQHLDQLRAVGGDLDNGDVQIVNGIKQSVAKAFGAGTPTSYSTVAQLVMNELDKATRGTGVGSSKEREHLAANAPLVASPDQLNSFITSAEKLMGGAIQSVHQKALATKNEATFNMMLTPRARAVLAPYLNAAPETPAAAPPAGGGLVEGTRGKSKSGKPTIVRNGVVEYE